MSGVFNFARNSRISTASEYAMDSGSIFFDPSARGHGNMLFLGNGDSLFRGGAREESLKKRPFFSSPEEVFDDEYYDEQLPEKKRRLTAEQVSMLEESFETENKLEPERKTQLAKHLGLHPRQVAVWFQNRRARWKTKQLERDYDLLKSSYDKLQSDHNSVLIHNETLKSQVVSLTEKLQAMAEKAPISDLLPVDRLSSGTGESAVVDEDGPQQLKDSCNSYFLTNDFGTPCIGPVQSEEEDRNDSRENYFADVFDTVTEQHQQQEEEPLGWWVWS